MDLITLTLSKNHLWSALSIVGIAGFTYLTNRYVNNTQTTTNQTYYKPNEVINVGNIQNTKHIIYIFWNGDIASTYLLIDLLLQDKLIHPFYIERYTIIKELEKDKLQILARDNIARDNIASDTSRLKDIKGNYKNKTNTTFLQNISSLKKDQEYEIKQIEILRLMILAQYPEFKNNLFPTTYITTIAKDLEYTSKFYNALLEIKPIHSKGIEFIEQVIRFLKYYGKGNGNSMLKGSRIILGCNKDYKNRELLINLSKKNIIYISKTIDIPKSMDIPENNTILNIPVLDMDDKTIKFMAVKFFPNDIMQYFMQID